MTHRQLLLAGAVFGALGVALGALGAHALEGAIKNWNLPEAEQVQRLNTWQVAVRYQIYHALALLAVGSLAGREKSRSYRIAGALFIVGIVIFSGCLYALALSGVKIFGAVVPIGGLCLIAGWLVLAVAVARSD